VGEASPLPGYSPDAPEEARRELEALAGAPLGRTADLDADPRGTTERVLDRTALRSPSARFALEAALLDLVGRRRGAPLGALLESGPRRPAPVNALLPLHDPEAAVAAAEDALRRGVCTLKGKLRRGRRFDADLAVLVALRARFGDGCAIRLDANGAWSVAEAQVNLRRLAEAVAPEWVEEPVAPADWAALADAPVPLAMDESLAGAAAGEILASGRVAVAALVLKPTVLGGLLASLSLARRAAELGAVAVVTHTFEGPVAHAAAAELAMTIGDRATAHGLDRHAGLEAFGRWAVPQLSPAGLRPVVVSGHGVDASEEEGA
jgi:o-succinylbenzoate synthase